jgi:hypothetical protein
MSGGGQGMCKEIARIREQGKTDRHAVDSITGIAKPVEQILGKGGVGASNDSDNSVVGSIKQNFSSIQDTLVQNGCKNISTTIQENIDAQPTICWTSMWDTCKNVYTGDSNIECIEKIRLILADKKPVKQLNKNNVTNNCEINAAIEVIASQEATAKNAAILHSLQEAKGLIASNKSDGFTCNEVDQTVTSEQYLKVLLECFQETAVKQTNKITSCHPNVSEQINDNTEMKKCLLAAGVLMKSGQSASALNQSEIKTGQTAVGLDPMASLASLLPIIIIFCVIILGAVFILPMLSGSGGSSGDSSGYNDYSNTGNNNPIFKRAAMRR